MLTCVFQAMPARGRSCRRARASWRVWICGALRLLLVCLPKMVRLRMQELVTIVFCKIPNTRGSITRCMGRTRRCKVFPIRCSITGSAVKVPRLSLGSAFVAPDMARECRSGFEALCNFLALLFLRLCRE